MSSTPGFQIRRSSERGVTDASWLKSFHTFSFGEYYDPKHMGFRALRVINDDIVLPGSGFPQHPHRNMEILTYVLEGTLSHRDSTGVVGTVGVGELQRMTAGRGILHSEYNHSSTEPVHLLQIWIEPRVSGLAPSHEQRSFSRIAYDGELRVIACGTRKEGVAFVNQDVELSLGRFSPGDDLQTEVKAGRYAWLHVAFGKMRINDSRFVSGDAVVFEDDNCLF